jgi:hypothetical protein
MITKFVYLGGNPPEILGTVISVNIFPASNKVKIYSSEVIHMNENKDGTRNKILEWKKIVINSKVCESCTYKRVQI